MAMKRSDLWNTANDRAGGRCEFPDCTLIGKVEMAHLAASGMGGSKYRDVPENVAMLCVLHHDWLDGRIVANARRFENEQLLRYALGRPWHSRR